MNNDVLKELKELDHLIKGSMFKDKKMEKKKPSLSALQIARYLNQNIDKAVYQKDIAEAVGLKKSTITECLDEMEKDKMIERIPDESDKRKNRIILTEKAYAMKKELDDALDKTRIQMIQGIDEERMKQFMETIELMKKNIGGR